ncbi:MAG: UDP-N-acetylglucosamine 1-carboxyvinyltransferase, partial [Clostridiales bacterium]|nr:UDP-N-acetylglucosamine 1-carboxyvinyltransferase [Clostridiales bacterium]
MEELIVTGGKPLSGSVQVHGAKNSVLPILAATLLTGSVSVLHNCPALSDVTASLM